jgi:RNase P/RNase MRP subunit p29
MKSKPIRKELIGRRIKVIQANNASNVGIEGRVVDATKHTLVVASKKPVRLMKRLCTLEVENNG